MYYICERCQYTFLSEENPHRCPDCGEEVVRPATETERVDHLSMMKIVSSDNWDDTKELSTQNLN